MSRPTLTGEDSDDPKPEPGKKMRLDDPKPEPPPGGCKCWGANKHNWQNNPNSLLLIVPLIVIHTFQQILFSIELVRQRDTPNSTCSCSKCLSDNPEICDIISPPFWLSAQKFNCQTSPCQPVVEIFKRKIESPLVLKVHSSPTWKFSVSFSRIRWDLLSWPCQWEPKIQISPFCWDANSSRDPPQPKSLEQQRISS